MILFSAYSNRQTTGVGWLRHAMSNSSKNNSNNSINDDESEMDSKPLEDLDEINNESEKIEGDCNYY